MSVDIRCPQCGKLQCHLELGETEGWFICNECEAEVRVVQDEGIERVEVRKNGSPKRIAAICPECGTKQMLYPEEITQKRCKCYRCNHEFDVEFAYGQAFPVMEMGVAAMNTINR